MSLAELIQKLWDLDDNRFVPSEDYLLDLQQGKHLNQGVRDVAPGPLFIYVNENKLFTLPTYSHFITLLDNYIARTGVKEIETTEERKEQELFINAVIQTPCHQHALLFIRKHSWWQGSNEEWALFLRYLWFAFYKREVYNDSSAFEHVFLGEIRNGKVIGFHNWISILLAEKKNILNYMGHVYPKSSLRTTHGEMPSQHLLQLQFSYEGYIKPLSTTLIGVSPEFELTLYTLVYLSREKTVQCSLDTVPSKIVLHEKYDHKGRRIGTAYVEI